MVGNSLCHIAFPPRTFFLEKVTSIVEEVGYEIGINLIQGNVVR